MAVSGHGFWMRDSVLELWLRLLALHLEEPPTADRPTSRVPPIRDQWLLASRGYFNGCVPDGLEDAVSTPEGKRVVVGAIESLMDALRRAAPVLDSRVLAILGMGGTWLGEGVDCTVLLEVGQASSALTKSGRVLLTRNGQP